jgi:hypothetical protein
MDWFLEKTAEQPLFPLSIKVAVPKSGILEQPGITKTPSKEDFKIQDEKDYFYPGCPVFCRLSLRFVAKRL